MSDVVEIGIQNSDSTDWAISRCHSVIPRPEYTSSSISVSPTRCYVAQALRQKDNSRLSWQQLTEVIMGVGHDKVFVDLLICLDLRLLVSIREYVENCGWPRVVTGSARRPSPNGRLSALRMLQ